MFNRKDQTYIIGDETIDRILCDPAQPLGQIATLLPDNVTVLDIGAGNGMLGRVLQRAGKKVTIDAIEWIFCCNVSEWISCYTIRSCSSKVRMK